MGTDGDDHGDSLAISASAEYVAGKRLPANSNVNTSPLPDLYISKTAP